MWFRENTEIPLWFTCFSKCQWFIFSHKQDWPKFSSFSRSIFHPNPVQPGGFIWGFTPSLLTLWTSKSFFPQLPLWFLVGFFFWFGCWGFFVCVVGFFSFSWNTSLRRGKETNHIVREMAGWLWSPSPRPTPVMQHHCPWGTHLPAPAVLVWARLPPSMSVSPVRAHRSDQAWAERPMLFKNWSGQIKKSPRGPR